MSCFSLFLMVKKTGWPFFPIFFYPGVLFFHRKNLRVHFFLHDTILIHGEGGPLLNGMTQYMHRYIHSYMYIHTCICTHTSPPKKFIHSPSKKSGITILKHFLFIKIHAQIHLLIHVYTHMHMHSYISPNSK